MYAQQVDPGPVIDFVLSHPCRGRRPAYPGQKSNIDASHSMVNLGHLWSCSRCKASYSVRVPARGRLAKKCNGGSAKKVQPAAKPSAGLVDPRPSKGPVVAPQARVSQPKDPDPSGFVALFSVGRSLANAPVSFPPGDDLGSVTGPQDPPVACVIASELGTPSARGPQPPFSSLEAEAQALPKAISNKVQTLSTGVSPTLPALPKAKATTANAQVHHWFEILSQTLLRILLPGPQQKPRLLAKRLNPKLRKAMLSRLVLRVFCTSLKVPDVTIAGFCSVCAAAAMGDGGSHGKGKGTKGKSKSKCSPEEIRHAAQLNAWRDSEDLLRKSSGSVTRAKARSAAFHAAKAAALDAQGIGPPVVKPPPPPPPPPRERRGKRSENTGAAVRLVERDEFPLPSQPGAGNAKAKNSGPHRKR